MSNVIPFPIPLPRVGRHQPKDAAARLFLCEEARWSGICSCGHTAPAHAWYKDACHQDGCDCQKVQVVTYDPEARLWETQ